MVPEQLEETSNISQGLLSLPHCGQDVFPLNILLDKKLTENTCCQEKLWNQREWEVELLYQCRARLKIDAI